MLRRLERLGGRRQSFHLGSFDTSRSSHALYPGIFEKLSLAYTITSRPKSFSRDDLFAKSHGVIVLRPDCRKTGGKSTSPITAEQKERGAR